jgi:DNA-binding MarR family transcriptional regulator
MTTFCYNTALRSAARQMTTRYDAALGATGIGSAQFTLLKTLAAHEPLALTELGARLRLDRSTIGRNVRVLEKSGLLKLGAGSDGRETAVALTAQGHEVLAAAAPLWEQAQTALERRLGKDGAANLRALLQALEHDAAD